LHVAARTVGHCAYLLMSLLMYPVSKQSAFAHLYGAHFPRVLAFHRYVGTAAFLVATLHALLWYVIWLGDGSLLYNVFASQFLKISPACVHRDQFSIPIMETLWLLMLISLILAVVYRRRTGMYAQLRTKPKSNPGVASAALTCSVFFFCGKKCVTSAQVPYLSSNAPYWPRFCCCCRLPRVFFLVLHRSACNPLASRPYDTAVPRCYLLLSPSCCSRRRGRRGHCRCHSIPRCIS
jgi:hypothetical protein